MCTKSSRLNCKHGQSYPMQNSRYYDIPRKSMYRLEFDEKEDDISFHQTPPPPPTSRMNLAHKTELEHLQPMVEITKAEHLMHEIHQDFREMSEKVNHAMHQYESGSADDADCTGICMNGSNATLMAPTGYTWIDAQGVRCMDGYMIALQSSTNTAMANAKIAVGDAKTEHLPQRNSYDTAALTESFIAQTRLQTTRSSDTSTIKSDQGTDCELQPLNSKQSIKMDTHNNTSTNSITPKSTYSDGIRRSKFCHECGCKFIVEHAKFCMDCGIKRIIF